MEILTELVKLSPIIGVLVVALIYFYKKEKAYTTELKSEREECDARIDNLNKELRQNEIDNLDMLSKLTNALDKLSDSTKLVVTDISKELIDLRHTIEIRLNDLQNDVKNNSSSNK